MKEDEAALIIQTAFRRWSIQNYMKKEIYEEFERCEEECRIIEGFQRKQPLQKEVKKKEHLENMKNDKSIENEKRMELIEKLLWLREAICNRIDFLYD
ncbi:hypothetical protein SNEBB_006222 [Seison nebaliae]|nr:hypothetical protein SNEBB_006222 [Seison nebaliae]